MRVQRLLLTELLSAFLLVALIVTGVVFGALLLQYVHKYQVNLLSVLQAAPYLIPVALPITLPVSFLVACLLTYGRFSDDNEFLALQMGGIHPWHAAAPAVATAAVLAIGTVKLNSDVIPLATLAKNEIARGEVQDLLLAVDDPGRTDLRIGGFQMSWAGRDERGLRDVLISVAQKRDPDAPESDEPGTQVIHAGHGRLDGSRLSEGKICLDLDDVDMQIGGEGSWTHVQEANQPFVIDIDQLVGPGEAKKPKSSSEMSNTQLWYKARRMRDIAGDDPQADNVRRKRLEYEAEYWRRIALGLAPVAFAFVGVGLGLGRAASSGRGSRMAAFLIAVLVALPVYHPLVSWGANLARQGVLPPALALNAGNVLLCGIGLWRFGRVVG